MNPLFPSGPLLHHIHLLAAITCEPITAASFSNGVLSGACGGSYNDTCTYSSCREGFNLSSYGSQTRRCDASGVYTGDAMACLRELPLRSSSSCAVSWYASLVFIRLHLLVAHSPTAITCPALTLLNGNVTGNCSGNYNDTCTYSVCNEGFRFAANGSTTRRCNSSGVYSGTEKTCNREYLLRV
jgi:hypothetical protein